MEPDMNETTWTSSPLSAIREPVSAPSTLSEGPVKFLLVSGQLDDGRRLALLEEAEVVVDQGASERLVDPASKPGTLVAPRRRAG